MSTQDSCCTIMPYFTVSDSNMAAFKSLCEQFVSKTQSEENCLYYGFSFDGNKVFCREGYLNAEALLEHLENVGSLLEQALQIATIARLEVHGPESELAKLREPLAALNPQFFTLEFGFRKG